MFVYPLYEHERRRIPWLVRLTALGAVALLVFWSAVSGLAG
mgnify:CR=1 FL=1